MNLLSVIGTRPQYVKVKPIFDYCNENKIKHIIVDTNQHYSENVSDYFIEEFSLIIDHDLRISNNDEVSFIAQTMERFSEILKKEKPDFVLIYGDTNSTLSSSLVCYKHKIPFGHVEAGLRCNDIKVPEELNRIVADLTSQIQFTPKETGHIQDFFNNEIVSGDLEYELLNRYYDKDIDTERYNLATEGKINYYIYPRGDARTPAGNIDTFKSKALLLLSFFVFFKVPAIGFVLIKLFFLFIKFSGEQLIIE